MCNYLIILFYFILVACGKSTLHNAQSTPPPKDEQKLATTVEQEDVSADLEREAPVQEDGRTTEVLIGASDGVNIPTDVIFAVDTSGSMKEETEKLEETLPAFIEVLSNTFPDQSFQMFMLAGEKDIDVTLTNPDQRYHIKGDYAVDSTNALEIIYDFVNDPSNQCAAGQITDEGCIRANSRKEIVVVSDDGSDYTATEFKGLIDNHDFFAGLTSVNGFVGTSVNNDNQWCSIEEVGDTYLELASALPSVGLVQHLCDENYTNLLANLSDSIIKKSFKSSFELKSSVNQDEPITVELDGTLLDDSEYSVSGNVLTLLSKGIDENQSLTVVYTAN
ncbi:MAG: hypothetical protein HRU09_10850 [Oligoflexales bacterium]|nr:hypothetical protein [Oligoflexales bacterium]